MTVALNEYLPRHAVGGRGGCQRAGFIKGREAVEGTQAKLAGLQTVNNIKRRTEFSLP